MIALYHQTKIPISFWYRRRLYLRSLIKPLDILPVELTGTHLTPQLGLDFFSFFSLAYTYNFVISPPVID